MNDQLMLLILEHLQKANGNPLPAMTLFIELRHMTTPMVKKPKFDEVVADLVRRKFIGTEKDRLTRGNNLFIKGAGRTYLRDRE